MELLSSLQAAIRLGITTELLFQFTKTSFKTHTGFSSLKVVEKNGETFFSIQELDKFDNQLRGSWCKAENNGRRAGIPKAIQNHLRAESQNQCARCGSGVGVEYAHIIPWSVSYSHHPHNLIRICSSCHKEHDSHNSLSSEELSKLKNKLIARTRANLRARLNTNMQLGSFPRAARHYFGRTSELEKLCAALESRESISIVGAGGIGKTELLLQSLKGGSVEKNVIWCSVERYKTLEDLIGGLCITVAIDVANFSINELANKLDAIHACIVFDGIEQTDLDTIQNLEDFLTDLHDATRCTQFIFTSQVVLYRLPVDVHIRLLELDTISSKQLFEISYLGEHSFNASSISEMLKFCQGHALTIKIASALTEYYGTPEKALLAIRSTIEQPLSLPERSSHTRQTSLNACLQVAYESLNKDSRNLLYTLAIQPAGMITHYVEDSKWGSISNPKAALASLRRWHLASIDKPLEKHSRCNVLSPIRYFAINKMQIDHPEILDKVMTELVQHYFLVAAVLNKLTEDPNESPIYLTRYGQELPNFLSLLELVRERGAEPDLVERSVHMIKLMMPYFFVSNQARRGGQAMLDAAELSMVVNKADLSTELVLQFLCLARRYKDKSFSLKSVPIIRRIQRIKTTPELSLCKAILALCVDCCSASVAEQFTQDAIEGFEQQHKSLGTDLGDGESYLSSSLNIMGDILNSQGRFSEAECFYLKSLQRLSGSEIAVNRGQLLHQLGNCKMNMKQYSEGADLYLEAASIFNFVEMQEYLGNALSELGNCFKYVDLANYASRIDEQLIDNLLDDLEIDIRKSFAPTAILDHFHCVEVIRKLFGSIALISLVGLGRKLADYCQNLSNGYIDVLISQLVAGERSESEVFPVMIMDLLSSVGLLVSKLESEQSNKKIQELCDELSHLVYEAPEWAFDVMMLDSWLHIYLNSRFTDTV